MSVASIPRRLPARVRSQPDLAEICRARKSVAMLGGRISLELGIDVDRDPDEVEPWALAATLLDGRISPAVAMRTYRAFEQAGVRTIEHAGSLRRADLIALLDESGYALDDERTASRLVTLAQVIADRYHGRLVNLGNELADSGELERALTALPGWGQLTVQAFLRELRGVWPGAAVPLDARAARAARHLELPAAEHAFAALAAAAHLDFRDLEAGLTRLYLCHDLASCPGAEECPLAAFDSNQYVQF